MLIRPATAEDYQGVCTVLGEVDALHWDALPHVFRDPGIPARSKAYITSAIEAADACLWVAEHEGQIVGVLHVQIRQSREIPLLVPRRYAEIETLAVSQTHRRRGIGRALVEAADRWAQDAGIDQVELGVWEFNEGARAFYEALGYRTASRKMWRRLPGREPAPIEPGSP
jgi:ribosomal protein S18 acetylase RimI-like enzyme